MRTAEDILYSHALHLIQSWHLIQTCDLNFCFVQYLSWHTGNCQSKVHSRLIGVIGFLRRWLAAEEISKLYTELPLNQVRFWNKNKGPLRSSESAVFSRRVATSLLSRTSGFLDDAGNILYYTHYSEIFEPFTFTFVDTFSKLSKKQTII